ncbi:MAG TPA: DNA polymerase I [Candidatus Binataceae bacterium]|nr:DNA polymerase I [Candidatus Binataceae bacterium]
MVEPRRELILVDGSGYIFRAFFAIPQLNNSRGIPTNAVFGFIRMLLKLLKEARPSHIAVVFDAPGKTFRDDLFADYKANRAETPNDLRSQIPFIHRAVQAMRIQSVVIAGYEADDVIGTLAARAAKQRIDTVLVTADKDFMQLVGPHVSLWDTMRDRRTTAREIKERFGVEPHAMVDIQALTGDAIDNVKGVPGIGEKTASALIQKFGDIDNLYRHLEEVEHSGIRGAKKVMELLGAHRAAVELARKLVRIDTDVPLELDPADLEWKGIDERAAAGLMRELEFHSMLNELAPSQIELPMDSGRGQSRASSADIGAVIATLKSAERIAIDLSADAAGAERLAIRAVDNSHRQESFLIDRELIREAAEILGAPAISKVCHDVKSHLRRLARLGFELNGADFDTMIAGFLINSGRAEPSLDDLYHEHLAPLGPHAGSRAPADLVAALFPVLAAKLRDDQLEALYRDIEMPVAPILAEMEAAGVGIDASALKKIGAEFGEQMNRLEHECYKLAGRELNLNSPNQLREVLFATLKLPTKGIKKSKSGYSTDADTLEKLAAAHPMPAKLLEYRSISKLKSTYADALGELIDRADGRLHTTFHQAVTATGRLSSSDPNLQNIPTRTQEGRRIRRAFIAREGWMLLSADYSQIDLRVLAHLSADPTLIDAFQRGEDIHARTAIELLGIAAGQVDAEARRVAKTINFGLIYGMGPQRLAAQLGISLAAAQDYIKRYFDRLPRVRAYFEETLARARSDGFVTTMYGRRRYLPELSAAPGGARAQAERIAINTPIQGTAADLIKLAMIRLHSEIRRTGMEAVLVMQVHDELLLEVRKDALHDAAQAARREMEGVATMRVPLKADLKWGSNWAEMGGDK